MNRRARLAVFTSGRQDYGILRSTAVALQQASWCTLQLLAGGMHLNERFGRTIEQIQADMLPVADRLDFVGEPPDPVADTGRAVMEAGRTLRLLESDALIVAGDRSETLAAALAATIQRVPVVHLHGGEESEGAIDNAFRHAVTKLSHLHLVSHEVHARRVIQMGEDPATVVVVGAPGLDNLYRQDLPGKADLERSLGVALEDPIVIVTHHPATLGGDPLDEALAIAAAMEDVPATYVITAPNADSGGEAIRQLWEEWSHGRSRVVYVPALGERRYWGLLLIAAAVLGNSSSGLVEAPQAGVPTVNVGDRQKGRLRGSTVLDAAPIREEIRARLLEALHSRPRPDPLFIAGPSAPRIMDALQKWLPRRNMRKAFRWLEAETVEPTIERNPIGR